MATRMAERDTSLRPESGDRKSETLVTTTLSAIMSDPTICLLVTFRFKMNWNFERL